MATLHVRNVPEPLYEALRDAADANGRSIGAEAIHLLTTVLFGRRRSFPRPAGLRRTGSLEAFGPDTRAAIADGERIARALGHDHVRSEHMLLALAEDPASDAAAALREREIGLDALRDAVARHAAAGEGAPEGPLPFGPDAKEALELALRESLRSYSRHVRSMHLFLGLLGAKGAAAAALAELGLDANEVRAAPYRAAVGMEPVTDEFRVVELQDDWEAQLNELADEYELVQIVERRAIFRRR